MKILGENGIGKFLKVFLQICFWGGIVLLIALPLIAQIAKVHLNASIYMIYPNGIVLLVIVKQFIGQFDSLKNKNPFCIENSKRLKNCCIASLIETVLLIIDLLYMIFLAKSDDIFVLLVMVFMIILFTGVSIAFYILSELIKQATEYKNEKFIVLGPSPAKISKISNNYRHRLAIKCKNSKSVRRMLNDILQKIAKMKEYKEVTVGIDLNPYDMN